MVSLQNPSLTIVVQTGHSIGTALTTHSWGALVIITVVRFAGEWEMVGMLQMAGTADLFAQELGGSQAAYGVRVFRTVARRRSSSYLWTK